MQTTRHPVAVWLESWANPGPAEIHSLETRTGCSIGIARLADRPRVAGPAVHVSMIVLPRRPRGARPDHTWLIRHHEQFPDTNLIVVRNSAVAREQPAMRAQLTPDGVDVIQVGSRAAGWEELVGWLNDRFGAPPSPLGVLAARIEAAYQSVHVLTEALRRRDVELRRLGAEVEQLKQLRVRVEQLELINEALLKELRKRPGPDPKTSKGLGGALKLCLAGALALGGIAQGVDASLDLLDRATKHAEPHTLDLGDTIINMAVRAVSDLDAIESTPEP